MVAMVSKSSTSGEIDGRNEFVHLVGELISHAHPCVYHCTYLDRGMDLQLPIYVCTCELFLIDERIKHSVDARKSLSR